MTRDDDIIKKIRQSMGREPMPKQKPRTYRKRKPNKKKYKKTKNQSTVVYHHYHNQKQEKQKKSFDVNKPSISSLFSGERNNSEMSLSNLLSKKSDSPYSFSNQFNKDKNKKGRNISPYFFLGLALYILSVFGPMYLSVPKIVVTLLNVSGVGCILVGVFFTGVSKEKRKDMKKTWWTFVNKIRVKKGKTIKCLNCGKEDFTMGKDGAFYCDKCGEKVIV